MNMNEQRQFSELRASELYCPTCRRAMPVREKLLLVLPDGELRQYVCAHCGADLGTKRETQKGPHGVR